MFRKKKINRNYLDTVLEHNPELKWKERKDGIVVIDMVNKGFFHTIAQKFFRRPKVSHIALDKYGTSVWKALDGKRTVFDVANEMKSQYPEDEDLMLNRVVTFTHTLQVNHFVVEITTSENSK